MDAGLRNPTMRKLRNRGLTPIRYRTPGRHECVRHGWIEREDERELVIRLVGDDRNRILRGRERAMVVRL